MAIPPPSFVNSLKPYTVCYFNDLKYGGAPRPHHHIIIPINDDSKLLMVKIETNYKERQDIYLEGPFPEAAECVIQVDKTHFPFLKHESGIDCNHLVIMPKNGCQNRIDPTNDPRSQFKIEAITTPEELKPVILRAIKDSPIVKKIHKKLLKR